MSPADRGGIATRPSSQIAQNGLCGLKEVRSQREPSGEAVNRGRSRILAEVDPDWAVGHRSRRGGGRSLDPHRAPKRLLR